MVTQRSRRRDQRRQRDVECATGRQPNGGIRSNIVYAGILLDRPVDLHRCQRDWHEGAHLGSIEAGRRAGCRCLWPNIGDEDTRCRRVASFPCDEVRCRRVGGIQRLQVAIGARIVMARDGIIV